MNKPNIRFSQYDKEWDFTQLDTLIQRVVRKNSTGETNLPLTVSAQYGLIAQDKFFNSKIASSNLLGYYLVRNGEFAYNKSSSQDFPFGAVKRLDEHEKGALSTLYIVFRVIDDKNSDFLVSFFDTTKWYDQVRKKACEGARNHGLLNISAEDFFSIELSLPNNSKEKSEIGLFFKELNTLIRNKEAELKKTLSIRQSCLQNMFPQNGETVPRIRFEGYNKPWDSVLLGDIADVVNDKNLSYQTNEVFTNSATKGIISQADYFNHEIAKQEKIDEYTLVREDDFVYNPRISVSAPVGPISRNKLGRSGAMSPLYTVFRVHDIDKGFLEYFFETTIWHKFMRFNGNTGARFDRFSILLSTFFEMPILTPDKEEQTQIAQFFQNLDKQIDLQQKELERFKRIKQALLNQMFV